MKEQAWLLTHKGYYILIDEEDIEKIGIELIHRTRKGYFVHSNPTKSVHRIVMDAPKSMQIDHINGKRWDNRKENLRLCTNAQNQQNRRAQKSNNTGYKGVYSAKGKYRATLAKDGIRRHLGYFTDPKKAHEAYCEAAKEIHGEYHNPG